MSGKSKVVIEIDVRHSIYAIFFIDDMKYILVMPDKEIEPVYNIINNYFYYLEEVEVEASDQSLEKKYLVKADIHPGGGEIDIENARGIWDNLVAKGAVRVQHIW